MLITIDTDGAIETHITHPTGDYSTACGLDGDEDDLICGIKQKVIDGVEKAVNCSDCILLWEHLRKVPSAKIAK